ncbi:hypothetical protein C7T94_08990 [Pedobacter yulinensis]|uniref:Uncharacterized protein n=1 Tax=Pedobacter yulinensis TaxID=2126353 RepID=A0A2T3HK03_9SPHI|nr:DUF6766 family protein [Pedobacter yulinensis]PST82772.1 hypothetical protein C7T94_08990 [Pedobacter yulinensis]
MKNELKRKYSYLYRNGLSIVFVAMFLVTLAAQAVTGFKEHNQLLEDKLEPAVTFSQYLGTGHFISATFENFESEFLQMALYVLLTVKLRQLGSAESKKLDGAEDVDREPVAAPGAPWPVRKGGWVLKIYSNSLSIVFILLFLFSWGMHFYGSWVDYNVEQKASGKEVVTAVAYLGEPRFWFETFQNWQSEFLSVASIVILTIFLRQKGSPESKPVDAPDLETGK